MTDGPRQASVKLATISSGDATLNFEAGETIVKVRIAQSIMTRVLLALKSGEPGQLSYKTSSETDNRTTILVEFVFQGATTLVWACLHERAENATFVDCFQVESDRLATLLEGHLAWLEQNALAKQ